MSADADYKSDKKYFDAYYNLPIKDRSLRKLGAMFGCSYENVRRKIKRYRSFQEYAEMYSVLPTKVATILIKGKLDTAEKIIKSTDKEILKVKGIGLAFLPAIREAFPYDGEKENVEIPNVQAQRKIKLEYSKYKYWKNSKKWKRKKKKK